MATIFLEIVLPAVAPEDRHEIEAALHEALEAAAAGEVTGGGTGGAISNIDVEVTDVSQALAIIRTVLRDLDVGESAAIKQYEPVAVTHPLHESKSRPES